MTPIEVARSYIGQHGSHFWQHVGHAPEEWCGDFFATVCDEGGAPVPYHTSWVPNWKVWAEQHGAWLPNSGSPDLTHNVVGCLHDWNGDALADHVTLVAGWNANGTVDVIGGNQGGGGLANSTVSEWNASRSQILGFFISGQLAAPVVPKVPPTPPPLNCPQDPLWYNNAADNPLLCVMLARCLNYVSGRGLVETGTYDAPTFHAMQDFQKFMGMKVQDGQYRAVDRLTLQHAVNVKAGR